MKGNQMRRNHLLKYTAVLLLAGGLFASMPLDSFANNDVGKGASKKYMQSGSEQSSSGQSGSEQSSSGQSGSNWQDTQLAGTGEGTDPGVGVHGSGVTEVAGGAYAFLDDEAPAATGAYGYSREEAQALCDYLYGFKTDPVKLEIAESMLMNSIWYDPQNIMKESGGKHLLKLYEGPKENYKKTYLEALDGLEFFPNPTVMFLQDSNGKVIVAVETGSRFTEEQAAANFGTIRGLVPVIEELKAATAQKDDSDTAKYISDYVAGKLEYDTSFSKNSLGDALRYGVDNEPFWIFSDKYREGQYYSNFRMVETPDGFNPQG